MAPEQEREGIITVKTDVYGLGMTFLHLFVPGGEHERHRVLFFGETRERKLNLLAP
jgi:hypothetical protein